MNLVFRNPALLQWQALMPGAALRGVREVVFHTGMRWPGAATEPPQVWFVESGLLALEQRSAGGFVDVAWIGGEGAVPLLEHGALGLRALCDGRALCLPVAQALSQVPALLLGWQQDLRARMARLAACARAHRPAQALADALLWAHRVSADADLRWSKEALSAAQRLPADQLDSLLAQWVAAGALRHKGQALQVHDAAVLATMACGCHAAVARPAVPPSVA
jgi:hypothetical protein